MHFLAEKIKRTGLLALITRITLELKGTAADAKILEKRPIRDTDFQGEETLYFPLENSIYNLLQLQVHRPSGEDIESNRIVFYYNLN